MNVYEKPPLPNTAANKMRLTNEQIKFIESNNRTLTPREIAEHLDLRYSHVSSYISRNRLFRLRKTHAELTAIKNVKVQQETEFFNIDAYYEYAITI